MPRARAEAIAGSHGGFDQAGDINARITDFIAATGTDRAR